MQWSLDNLNFNAPRPMRYMELVRKNFSGINKIICRIKTLQLNGEFECPKECFLSVEKWLDVFKLYYELNKIQLNKNNIIDIDVLPVLLTWQYTKDYYKFDKFLFTALLESDFDGKIPIDVLLKFKSWAVYIELPPQNLIYGFFISVTFKEDINCFILQIMLDTDRLIPLSLILKPDSTIEQLIETTLKYNNQNTSENLVLIDLFKTLMPLILYINSLKSDIKSNHKLVTVDIFKTKKEWKLIPPYVPNYYTIGENISQQLALYEKLYEKSKKELKGKKMHLRRGHWHTYLIGENRCDRVLKWQCPTVVGS